MNRFIKNPGNGGLKQNADVTHMCSTCRELRLICNTSLEL